MFPIHQPLLPHAPDREFGIETQFSLASKAEPSHYNCYKEALSIRQQLLKSFRGMSMLQNHT